MILGPCFGELLSVSVDDDGGDPLGGCFSPGVVDVLNLPRALMAVDRGGGLGECEFVERLDFAKPFHLERDGEGFCAGLEVKPMEFHVG